MKVPSKQTLRRYGINEQDWIELYNLNNGICPICERPIDNPVVDHFHIRNWKKMKAEKRRLYIRGLPCNYCNRRRLARGMNLKIARNIVTYLEKFEKKLQGNK